MSADIIFGLPELTCIVALHLPLGSLFQTFTEDPTHQSSWSRRLNDAIRIRQVIPPDLQWYKDVYRCHAKYIHHLTLFSPVILDACLEDAFVSFSVAGVKEEAAESHFPYLFPRPPPGSGFGISTGFDGGGFGGGGFGGEGFGAANNNIINTEDDNNIDSITPLEYRPIIPAETAAEKADPERPFIEACQRLIICNPRCTPYDAHTIQNSSGRAFRSLKNLTMTSADGQIPALPPSVTNLTMLRSLAYYSNSKQVLRVQGPASRVTVLNCQQVQGGPYARLPEFQGFLQCFPLLVDYHDEILYPTVATQLVENCPLLEVIRVRHEKSIRRFEPRRLGNPIDDCASLLLSSLSRLRVLELPHETIKAENVLERPWVCFGLEEFSCQIVDVPFLTKEEELQVQKICQREVAIDISDRYHVRTDKEDELMERSERCVSTRKQIMAQLSKLTSLKYLSLSPDLKIGNGLFVHRFGATRCYTSERDGRVYIRYDDVLPDTLSLRLDIGLAHLASLKKLEYLGFESMDHCMETAEVQWMARELPRLKEIRGLVTGGHVGMEPDPKNDALVALMRTLRPANYQIWLPPPRYQDTLSSHNYL
ncbi:hypothetical protein BGZ96_004045 [Linnemannia gamsii]|uniref:F-box domain-containing protein n=1 Tax=Linnemannia gamsii TaxID=64522 RepID=A0ABQ7K706_9FUNG|nr:hypothetical protein BGZ96_004045 [Linnemannia gamsii]